jgi:hypothetical protein
MGARKAEGRTRGVKGCGEGRGFPHTPHSHVEKRRGDLAGRRRRTIKHLLGAGWRGTCADKENKKSEAVEKERKKQEKQQAPNERGKEDNRMCAFAVQSVKLPVRWGHPMISG